MRATGIIRRVDDLGRIVIPKNIREQLSISAGEPFEIFIDHESGTVCFQRLDRDFDAEADIRGILDKYEYDLSSVERAVLKEILRRTENK